MKRYTIILIFLYSLVQAQENNFVNFALPFELTPYLSGNFGELRFNHFHGGLDFKTEGVEGKPLHCIERGYISRITVSPGGYGNALYVTHPNGYTSVHGHLRNFVSSIASFVEAYQYENETFAVDIKPDSSLFIFEKGAIIAYGGNSGYSFGPHLHMEIRETATNETIDPLQFYKRRIKDDKPPVASAVIFYPQNEGVVNGIIQKQSYTINAARPFDCLKEIEAWGEIGVGISAYDYMTGTSNRYGVHSVTLYVDSVFRFNSTVDRFSFEENRMINSWTDYAEFRVKGHWYMKSFIEPGNPLRMLTADENRGIIKIDEERNYHFQYVLNDLYGNTAVYEFIVKGKKQEIPKKPDGKHYLRWNRMNIVQEPGMHMIIPRNMLYNNVELATKVIFDSSAISFEYQLHDMPVPLHKSCELLIGIRNMPVEDTEKYYIAHKNGERYSYVGGSYEEGWLRASVSELGTYKIAIDTIPPKVEPLNKANWRKANAVSYKISDAQTGIRSYKGKINGKFALFGFDAKSGKLTHLPDKRSSLKSGSNSVEIVVEDNCGNVTRVTESFNW